jgi:5'-3' exonuclease
MLVCSADRDLYQMVTEKVHVVVPRGGGEPEVIDEAGVRSRAGVAPAQIPDLIALRGDPSDGLPGARGIGAKTAAALLAAHGSLDGVLAAPPGALRPRLAATLREQESLLRAFRDVATLREVDVVRPPDGATDRTRGAAAAEELGMGRLAARLRES